MTGRDRRGSPTLPKGGSLTERGRVENPAPSKRGLRWRPNGHRPYFQELRIRQQTASSVPDPGAEEATTEGGALVGAEPSSGGNRPEEVYFLHPGQKERGRRSREKKYRKRLRRSERERIQCLRRLRDLSMPLFWYVELTLGVHLYLLDVDGACALAEEHME